MTQAPAVLVVMLAATAVAAAGIEGTVALRPAQPPVDKPRYPLAATYEVGAPDPPVAVIWVEAPADAPAAAEATLAQEHYQFAPGVLAVRRGTRVAFPNRDEEYHSVFSYSKPKRFDLGRYARDETPATVTFDEPGVVQLFCEIHEHMRGTIVVVDTPWFTRSDAAGRYRLDGLPPGPHTVHVWAGDDARRTATVEVSATGTTRLDFAAP
ncbi:MAG: carboxypeptidase regulatory-like domain-containing protein [bacterium]|nr:carboxypeptidase regulatory-like domain-containing protein [bacterium]